MSCRRLLLRPFITGPQRMSLNLGAQVGIATAGGSTDLLSIHAPAIFKLPMVDGTFAINARANYCGGAQVPSSRGTVPSGQGAPPFLAFFCLPSGLPLGASASSGAGSGGPPGCIAGGPSG